MRFLNLAQRYHPAIGGSEWYMKRISEDLAARGNDVKVVTTDAVEVDALWRSDAKRISTGRETINGVDVVRLPVGYLPMHGWAMTALSYSPLPEARYRFSMPGPLLPSLEKIIDRIGAYEYNVVHATALPFTSILWTAHKLASRRNVPLIITPFMHIDIPDRIGYGYRKQYQVDLLAEADAVIASTPTERDFLVQLGLESDRVKTVKLGVDPASLPEGDGASFRKKYNLSGAIVFNVSARTYEKGAVHLLDAMRLLWSEGFDAHLVMAGPARRDFADCLNNIPPEYRKRILDLGVVDDKTRADIFDAGDVFCMPSRAESFGLVYLEAWRYGAVVIAANAGAVPDVVRHNQDGILVEFGDVRGVAESIKRAITDKTTSESMIAEGRKKIQTEFNWSRSFGEYLGVIEMLKSHKIQDGKIVL